MSRLIPEKNHKRTLTKKGSKYYVVSTGYSVDYGWQTMVYEAGANSRITNDDPVFNIGWENEREAMKEHKSVVWKYTG